MKLQQEVNRIKEEIQTCQGQLDTLKQRFQSEAVFSEEKLQSLQSDAWAKHPKQKTFYGNWIHELCSTLQQKIKDGYEYDINIAGRSAYSQGGFWSIYLDMPSDLLDQEQSALYATVKDVYAQSLKDSETKLIDEMAKVKTNIERLESELKSAERDEKNYSKNLDQIRKELLSELGASA